MAVNGATERLTSIVLPVHNQADHIEAIVRGYTAALSPLPRRARDRPRDERLRRPLAEICARLAEHDADVRHVDLAARRLGPRGQGGSRRVAAATSSATRTPRARRRRS